MASRGGAEHREQIVWRTYRRSVRVSLRFARRVRVLDIADPTLPAQAPDDGVMALQRGGSVP